jgi:hypothetical protein
MSDTQPDVREEKSPGLGTVAASDGLTSVQSPTKAGERTGLADLDGIKRNWTLRSLIVIWISAGLMSFVVNLNNQSSSTFAPYAVSGFSSAPLVGTIAVVQAVIASGALNTLTRWEYILTTDYSMSATSCEICRSIRVCSYVFFSLCEVGTDRDLRRLEMFLFCIVMATIGEIMLSSSANVGVYAGAQVFWVIGLQGMTYLLYARLYLS